MTMRHKEALERAVEDLFLPAADASEQVEAAIRAYLDAMNSVIAPKEPTAEMVRAGDDEWDHQFANSEEQYRAMVAAAPDPFGDA